MDQIVARIIIILVAIGAAFFVIGVIAKVLNLFATWRDRRKVRKDKWKTNANALDRNSEASSRPEDDPR